MGGRGAGKTRAGAEWLREQVVEGGARRVALVAPTLGDAREVMIEGVSGVRRISPPEERPVYEPSRRRLVWPNGAEGFVFSAEDPDSLRGPQFDAAWCDEIAAWTRGRATFDTLMLALRIGERPRCLLTTTPRSTELVRGLVGEAGRAGSGVVMTRSGTRDNSRWLAPGFVDSMESAYAGTRLARQELEGELIEDPPGALWTREMIEAARGRLSGETAGDDAWARVVVAVDPPAGVGPGADACGIIAAALGADGRVNVLADASVRGLRPLDWARRVIEVADAWGAGEIAAESNQGGEMVRDVLRAAGCGAGVRVRLVRAVKSKYDRASPVSAYYSAGRVVHRGVFRELEDEMCAFGASGLEAPAPRGASPDRVDALVWAVTLLLDAPGAPPRVREL
ncbi:ATP-binding protein [bacterium]|nr:ATP-binding protein [bacterium]